LEALLYFDDADFDADEAADDPLLERELDAEAADLDAELALAAAFPLAELADAETVEAARPNWILAHSR